MITKLTNNPIVSLLLSILAFCLLSLNIYNAQKEKVELLTNSYSLINFPVIESPLLLTSLVIPIIIICCFLFVQINSKYRLVEHEQSPFFLYFFTGLLVFPFGVLDYTVFTALTLCLVTLRVLLSIHNQASVMIEIFLATTLVAIASILFYPAFFFLLLIISAVAILRPFRFKNYVLILVSFCLPFLYLSAFNFIFELELQTNGIQFSLVDLSVVLNRANYIPFIIVCVIALLSFIRLFTSRSKFIVRQRNQLAIIYIFTILLLIISFFSGLSSLLVFILLPFSLFFNYFHKNFSRKWIPELLLLVLYISAFFVK